MALASLLSQFLFSTFNADQYPNTIAPEIYNILLLSLLLALAIWLARVSRLAINMFTLHSALRAQQVLDYEQVGGDISLMASLTSGFSSLQHILRGRVRCPPTPVSRVRSLVTLKKPSLTVTRHPEDPDRLGIAIEFHSAMPVSVQAFWRVNTAPFHSFRSHINTTHIAARSTATPKGDWEEAEEEHKPRRRETGLWSRTMDRLRGRGGRAGQENDRLLHGEEMGEEEDQQPLMGTQTGVEGPVDMRGQVFGREMYVLRHPAVEYGEGQGLRYETPADLMIPRAQFSEFFFPVETASQAGVEPTRDSTDSLGSDSARAPEQPEPKLFPLVLVFRSLRPKAQDTEEEELGVMDETAVGEFDIVDFKVSGETVTAQLYAQYVQTPTANLELKEIYGLEATGTENAEECVVCLSEEKQVVTLPCRHLSVCGECFKQVDKCPICRTDIESYIVLKPSQVTGLDELRATEPSRQDQLMALQALIDFV